MRLLRLSRLAKGGLRRDETLTPRRLVLIALLALPGLASFVPFRGSPERGADERAAAATWTLRAGPVTLTGPSREALAEVPRLGCLRVRVDSTAVSDASILLVEQNEQGRDRPLAQKHAPFPTPGSRPVCLRIAETSPLPVEVVLYARVDGARLVARGRFVRIG